MTEIVTMTSGPLSLVIGLPTAGMPEIISFGLKAATGRIWRDDMRSSRVNVPVEVAPSWADLRHELGVVEDARTPRVLPDPDVTRLLWVAGGVVTVLLVVAVATSVAVVRRARAATLRETAG